MSWDSYVDSLIGNGQSHIDAAAICGLEGAAWTTVADGAAAQYMKPTSAEIQSIAGCMAAKDFGPFKASGVKVCGKKYMFLRADEDVGLVLAKGTGAHKEEAICIQKTTKAFIIAHCPAGKQPGKCNQAVDSIAQYLISNSYWTCRG